MKITPRRSTPLSADLPDIEWDPTPPKLKPDPNAEPIIAKFGPRQSPGLEVKEISMDEYRTVVLENQARKLAKRN